MYTFANKCDIYIYIYIYNRYVIYKVVTNKFCFRESQMLKVKQEV